MIKIILMNYDKEILILKSKEEFKNWLSNNKIYCFYERRVKENFKDQYEKVLKFGNCYYPNNDKSFSELLFCYVNDIISHPSCKHCGKLFMKFLRFGLGYRSYCSTKCSANSEEKKSTIEDTNLKKYGHKNIAHGIYKEQIKQTNLERYGSEYPASNEEVKEKVENTNLKKYGVKYSFQADEVKDKIRDTCIERYGVSSAIKNPIIFKKVLDTKAAKGLIYNFQFIDEYKKYRHVVRYYTNINFRKYYYEINPNRLKRSRWTNHVDHIYPIIEGFKNKIPPELIANYNNLQMLTWQNNKTKSKNTNMSTDDFYKLIGYESDKKESVIGTINMNEDF